MFNPCVKPESIPIKQVIYMNKGDYYIALLRWNLSAEQFTVECTQ